MRKKIDAMKQYICYFVIKNKLDKCKIKTNVNIIQWTFKLYFTNCNKERNNHYSWFVKHSKKKKKKKNNFSNYIFVDKTLWLAFVYEKIIQKCMFKQKEIIK